MLRDQMNIIVDGEPASVREGALLSDVLDGRPYEKGALVAVIRPSDLIKKETDSFEIVTSHGPIGLRLNDSPQAQLFRSKVKEIEGKGIRWQTSKILAIGAFPTDLEVSHDRYRYSKYDCFFATGGYDPKTTYVMIAKTGHEGQYGTTGAVLGKITTGRHILGLLKEGEVVMEIRPVVEQVRAKNALVTSDPDFKLVEGMSVETHLEVKLEPSSPISSEHFLVLTEQGLMPVTEDLRSYSACSSNLDVSLVPESTAVREEGDVTVRHSGAGNGRVYFYKTRRQVAASHNRIGRVRKGMELLRLAPQGSTLAIVADPARVMVIGMDQSEGHMALAGRGLKQRRTGDTADDAIIVEQEPELTMEAVHCPEIETFGVRPERINGVVLYADKAPETVHYFKKVTGLNHKLIGNMKVHFTHPEMPLITLEGDDTMGAALNPENEFKATASRGDLGATNMSRPNCGLLGIRLDASEEFGPTGEERHGTNLLGRFASDLDAFMKDINDGDIIYIREMEPESPRKAPRTASKRTVTSKGKGTKGKGKGEKRAKGP